MTVRDDLDRARLRAPAVAPDLEGLRHRRERRARRSRVATAALALAIGFSAVGGAWWSLREDGATTVAAGDLGPPSVDLSLDDGEYYVVLTRSTADYGGGGSTAHQEATFRTWWAADDSGRIQNIHGRWYDEGTFGPGDFPSDSGPVGDLSVDPVQLDAQLRARVEPDGASPEPYEDWGGPVEWGLIRSIAELLMAPDVRPDVKAALVQVTENLDGVDLGRGDDPLGRAAIVLSTHTEQKLNEWWFDPVSHQLLAIRETYDDGGAIEHIVEAAGVARSTDSGRLVRPFVPAAD
jgi:hypothetical protein